MSPRLIQVTFCLWSKYLNCRGGTLKQQESAERILGFRINGVSGRVTHGSHTGILRRCVRLTFSGGCSGWAQAVTSPRSRLKAGRRGGERRHATRRPASERHRSNVGASKSARGRGARRCHGSAVRSSTLKSIVSHAAEARAKRRGWRRVGDEKRQTVKIENTFV